MNKQPSENIISLTKNNDTTAINLEIQLKHDSLSLPRDVDEIRRTRLMQQLHLQAPQLNKPHLSKLPYALAASLLIGLISSALFFGRDTPLSERLPQVATSQEKPNPAKQVKRSSMQVNLGDKKKLVSQQLQTEYQAILADVDKLKNRIVAL